VLALGWGQAAKSSQFPPALQGRHAWRGPHRSRSKLAPVELFGEHREADDLRLGKHAAQDRSRLDAAQFRYAQVEEDQVATSLPCLLDGGDAVARLATNPVGSVDLEEGPGGATHGGAGVKR